VVHAYSNFEHRVQESLTERIRRAGLETKFVEIWFRRRSGRDADGVKRKSERKFTQAMCSCSGDG